MAVLLGFAFALVPPPAKAADPIDCTSGCNIVTCSGNYCTVWHCDSGGCIIVGGYELKPTKHESIIGPGQPAAFDGVCDVNGNKACAIKTCANGSCSISLFDRKSKSFVPIGETQDVDSMIKKARGR